MNTEDKRKMNKEFFEALALLEKEKGVPMNYLLEKNESGWSVKREVVTRSMTARNLRAALGF